MVENEEKIIRWNYPGKNAQPGQFRAHYFPKENSPPSSRGKDPRCEGKPLRNWNNERDFVRSFRRVKEGEERNDFSNWRKEASKRLGILFHSQIYSLFDILSVRLILLLSRVVKMY